jgi:nucleoid-associated protein YgaU
MTSSVPSPAGGTGKKATVELKQKSDSTKLLQFRYLPEKLKFSTTAKTETKPSSNQSSKTEQSPTAIVTTTSEVQAWGEVALTADSLYLIGPDTQAKVRLLLSWANAKETGAGQKKTVALETLLFTMGPMKYEVALKSVTTTFERFEPSGRPIRALCGLTMVIRPNGDKSTNPSSRAEPGSSVHELIDGESVVRLAELSYGHPRYWREIADANGLDDPLRLRPGRQIYLPPPAKVRGATS